jgi:transposase
MISIGLDAHKGSHLAVAVDDAGQVCGQWAGANSTEGWSEVLRWAQGLGAERRWGIEGAWNYGRGLAQHLLAAGESVHEVNTRWTAKERRRARNQSKTDQRDAQAIALYVWREGATLPLVTAEAEDEAAVLEVLVTQRDAAVAEATRLRNQAHQLLLQCDPAYRTHLPALTTEDGIAALEGYEAPAPSAVAQARAGAIRMLGHRLRLAVAQATELKAQIEARARAGFSPLIRLKGVNALTAGMLAAILGPGRRFQSDADLALYAGVAPLEVSSAGRVRHRLNRGGNRRLNAILYRIAVTQVRALPAAHDYVARRMGEGKTKREALRALKRFILRAVFRLWRECVPCPAPGRCPSGVGGPVPPEARTLRLPSASVGAVA